jgi:glycosyltransferase involved in cell wall biosynthesis
MTLGSTRTNSQNTRKLRILIVAPSLEILGGQSVQAMRLLKLLRADTGLQVDFLEVNPRLSGIFGRLQRVKYVRTVVTSLAYVVSLIRRVPRADLVHAFSASYFSYLLAPMPALIIGRVLGKATLLNYHSGEAPDHLRRWRLSRWTMKRLPDRIVVPSEFLVRVFSRFGLSATAIANFVPIDDFRYRERKSLAPKLLSNRNLEPMYNVACTLRAYSEICQRISDAELVVAGDGSQRATLENLASQLNLKNVTFTGKVPPEEMGRLYDSCDIYVNAPDVDNMPLSVLEAFAFGLPVVTTTTGGIPDIVRHEENGLLTACNDHHAIAASVLRLLDDQSLASRLARSARRDCEERYAPSVNLAEWASTYRNVSENRA